MKRADEATARASRAETEAADAIHDRAELLAKADEHLREAFKQTERVGELQAQLIVAQEQAERERKARDLVEAQRVEIAAKAGEAEAMAAQAREQADQAQRAREQAERHAARAQELADNCQSECEAARAAHASASDDVANLQAALERGREEYLAAEADYTSRFAEASTVTAAEIVAREAAEADLREQREVLATLETKLQIESAEALKWSTFATDLESRLNQATETLGTLQAERDALVKAEADISIELGAERDRAAKAAILAEQVKSEQDERATRIERELSEARATQDVLGGRTAELQAALDRLTATLSDQTAATQQVTRERDAERAQRRLGTAAVLAAHRALVVDVMTRMIDRETERARRAQATPEKLRTWMGTFYMAHEDLCRTALLPVVRVHLAWIRSGEDPEVVSGALAKAHCERSQLQLQTVLDEEPGDYAARLSGTLRRWETERANELADRLLEKEIDHARET